MQNFVTCSAKSDSGMSMKWRKDTNQGCRRRIGSRVRGCRESILISILEPCDTTMSVLCCLTRPFTLANVAAIVKSAFSWWRLSTRLDWPAQCAS